MATWGQQTWGYENWGTLGDQLVELSSISLTLSPGTVVTEGVVEIGWGGDTWGQNEWGDLSGSRPIVVGQQLNSSIGTSTIQANADIIVSGISASYILPGVVAGASAEVFPNSFSLTTAIGNDSAISISQNVSVTGIASTAGITAVTIDDNFLIGSGWGRESFGSMAWGDAYSVQTGSVSAQTAVGAVFTQIESSILVQGIALSTAIGDEVPQAGATASPTGIALSVTTGDETTKADAIVTPSGIALLVVTGDETTQADAIVTLNGIALSTAIGDEVSQADAIVSPNGISLSVITGDETTKADAIVSPNGIALSVATGLVDIQAGGNIFIQVDEHTLNTGVGLVNVEIAVEVFQEGMQLNTFIGDEEAFTGVTVSLAGIALSIAEPEIVVDLNTPVDVTGTEIISTTGIIDANPDANPIGIEVQTSIGQVISSGTANIDVSGNVLNTSIGQVISSGTANIDVTGISLASAIGDEEVFIDVAAEVTGISATYVFGDVAIESKYSVDGIPLSTAINSVTINASAVVTPTGIGLTITEANPNIIAWAEVDVGTEVTWTPVDVGTEVTWTQVDLAA